jgi:hypothetical protein
MLSSLSYGSYHTKKRQQIARLQNKAARQGSKTRQQDKLKRQGSKAQAPLIVMHVINGAAPNS